MDLRTPDPEEILDSGERALFSEEGRRYLGRCLSCEWHPETQGHDDYCPEKENPCLTPHQPTTTSSSPTSSASPTRSSASSIVLP